MDEFDESERSDRDGEGDEDEDRNQGRDGGGPRRARGLADWAEIALVECICEGADAEVMARACAELFRRNDERTRRTVEAAFRSAGLPPTDVEDVVNVVRLRLVECLPELRERRRFGAWYRKLATNAAINTMRALLRRRHFDVDSLGGCCGDEEWCQEVCVLRGARWDAAEIEVIEGIDLRVRLERALAALAPRERQAFELFYLEGLKYWGIAERMEIAEGTVGAHLAEAREKFFRAWAEAA
jgi:RNA polymerase sigma factor (sigma-70 family)